MTNICFKWEYAACIQGDMVIWFRCICGGRMSFSHFEKLKLFAHTPAKKMV